MKKTKLTTPQKKKERRTLTDISAPLYERGTYSNIIILEQLYDKKSFIVLTACASLSKNDKKEIIQWG